MPCQTNGTSLCLSIPLTSLFKSVGWTFGQEAHQPRAMPGKWYKHALTNPIDILVSIGAVGLSSRSTLAFCRARQITQKNMCKNHAADLPAWDRSSRPCVKSTPAFSRETNHTSRHGPNHALFLSVCFQQYCCRSEDPKIVQIITLLRSLDPRSSLNL